MIRWEVVLKINKRINVEKHKFPQFFKLRENCIPRLLLIFECRITLSKNFGSFFKRKYFIFTPHVFLSFDLSLSLSLHFHIPSWPSIFQLPFKLHLFEQLIFHSGSKRSFPIRSSKEFNEREVERNQIIRDSSPFHLP